MEKKNFLWTPDVFLEINFFRTFPCVMILLCHGIKTHIPVLTIF